MIVTQHTLNVPEAMNPLVERILNNLGNECLEYYDEGLDLSAFELVDAKRAGVIQHDGQHMLVHGAYVVADPKNGVAPQLVLAAAHGTDAVLFAPVEHLPDDEAFIMNDLTVFYITSENIGFVHMMDQ